MKYLGDFSANESIEMTFTTNDGSGGNVAPSAAFDNADFNIYKDGSATEKTTTTGVTVESPFDSIVGLHRVSIDMSLDTSFFTSGSDYKVVLATAKTVDGETVQTTVAEFSVENRAAYTAVSNIGTGGTGATNYAITDDNVDGALAVGGVFVGSEVDGTYAVLAGDNTTFHEIGDDSDAISIVYQTNIGGAKQAVNVLWQGYLNSGNDEVQIQAYNFATDGWDVLYTIDGKNNSNLVVEPPLRLTTSHTDTAAATIGDVFIRFYCTGQSGPTLYNAVLLVQAVSTATSVGYAQGAYWVDEDGVDGTEIGTNGTADNPCTWANAVSMNTIQALNRFHIANDTTVTLTAAFEHKTMYGEHYYLDMSGESINDSSISNATVTGIGTATDHIVFEDCEFVSSAVAGALATGPAMFRRCGFNTPLGYPFGANSDGEYVFIESFSLVAGSGTPYFDFSGTGDTTGINNRGWLGGANYTLDSDCTLSHEVLAGGGQTFTTGGGKVEVRGTCRELSFVVSGTGKVQFAGTTGPIAVSGVGGGNTVNLYGTGGPITDTSTGTVTINDGLNRNSTIIHSGFARESTDNTIRLDANASATPGAYDPAMISILHGTGAGQTRLIYGYDGGTSQIAVVDRDWKVNPDTTSDFRIITHPGREHVNEGLARGAGTGNNQIQLNALASADNDNYNGQTIFIRSGTGADQSRIITDYVGSTTQTATVHTDWDVNPDATSGYVMLPTGNANVVASDTTGPGSIEWDLIINDAGGDPIDGCAVWITTDEAGSDTIAGTLYTDALGQVTFMLDAGTYYVWRQRTNYTFTNPDTTTVS